MSARSTLLVVACVAVAALSACSSSTGSSSSTTGSGTGVGPDAGVQQIDVTISDAGCDPRQISATAGPTTFSVTNDDSAAVTEFEILDGDRILGEVENVVPGQSKDFSLTLAAGSYVTYCPNGETEHGTLDVSDAPAAAGVDQQARAAVVADYLTYVKGQSDQLITRTQAFTGAVDGGDVARAQALYASAREPYESIEPIAESFGDLDPAIDAREGDEPDEEWGGFHRLEKALWVDGDLTGMAPVADELLADVRSLRSQVDTIELEPAQIANGAVDLLNEVSTSKITGEEDRYGHTDLSDFSANLAGSRAAFDALAPLIAVDHADLVAELNTKFDTVRSALDRYRGGDATGNGYLTYVSLSADDTRALSTSVDALAEPLSNVAATVIL